MKRETIMNIIFNYGAICHTKKVISKKINKLNKINLEIK